MHHIPYTRGNVEKKNEQLLIGIGIYLQLPLPARQVFSYYDDVVDFPVVDCEDCQRILTLTGKISKTNGYEVNHG